MLSEDDDNHENSLKVCKRTTVIILSKVLSEDDDYHKNLSEVVSVRQ